MNKITGILWDNDGVLVDTERLFYEANRELFRRHDIDLSEQDFFNWYLADNCGAWHLLERRGATPADIADYRVQRNRLYAKRLTAESVPAVAGVEALLADLAPRLPMGVVTSATAEHFGIIHGRLGLLRHFLFVLTADGYTHSKPAPEPYLIGLQRLQQAPEDCLVIEDSPRGLEAARATGMRCVVVRGPLTRHFGFPGAYHIVDNMAELRAVLDSLS
jgi:HAD superfamily hydrolase (TIGR01509 family)